MAAPAPGRLHNKLVLKKVDGKPGKVWYPVPMLSDAVGEVASSGNQTPAGSRVLFNPGHGWVDDPVGPEKTYGMLGGTQLNPIGVAQDYVLIEAAETVPCPAHLTGEEAAALPLVGLTGWRAFVTKSGAAEKGQNILITGIGGGVAVTVLLFAVAMGVNVWVTSGDDAKIKKAVQLGAKGGVNYKSKTWDKDLKGLLPKDRPFLDAVIDGAGGDIVTRTTKLLKDGGAIVCYGMTLGPKMTTTMQAVLKNVDVRGSTMGSRKEFADMVAFVDKHKVRPIVSRVVEGELGDMRAWEELFGDMKDGKQFGKLVFKIKEGSVKSKL